MYIMFGVCVLYMFEYIYVYIVQLYISICHSHGCLLCTALFSFLKKVLKSMYFSLLFHFVSIFLSLFCFDAFYVLYTLRILYRNCVGSKIELCFFFFQSNFHCNLGLSHDWASNFTTYDFFLSIHIQIGFVP